MTDLCSWYCASSNFAYIIIFFSVIVFLFLTVFDSYCCS